MEVGHRHRPRRTGRDALDPRGEPVPEPAEPAASDRAVGDRLPAGDRGETIQHRERIVVGARATATGSEPTIAPPPAHAPVSANGNRSPSSASSTSATGSADGIASRTNRALTAQRLTSG